MNRALLPTIQALQRCCQRVLTPGVTAVHRIAVAHPSPAPTYPLAEDSRTCAIFDWEEFSPPPRGRRMSLAVVHIISSMEIGGAQQLLLDLCVETRERGHQVKVLALRGGPMTAEFRREGVEVEELPDHGLCSLLTLLELVAWLRHDRPDLVHTHLGKADGYGRVAARLAGVRAVVSTVHNIEKWKSLPRLSSPAADETLRP